MPRGDAVQTKPTVEQEMAKFKSFAVRDGEVADGKATEEENRALKVNTSTNAALVGESRAAAEAQHSIAQQAQTTGEGAPDPEETPEQQPADETPEAKAAREAKAAKQRSADKRIGDAVKKQRAAERERDELRGRLSAIEARLNAPPQQGLTPQKDAPTNDGSVAPKPQDFEYGELDARYIRALARYEAKQELLADRQEQERTQQTAAQRREAAELQTKIASFDEAGSAKYEDFSEVVIEGAKDGTWPLSPTLGRLILNSEHGPDIAYALASDPKEAQRVSRLSDMEQAAYFGRQEAKFSSASSDAGAKQAPKTTQAPPPPNTRVRGAQARTSVPPDTSDFAAFEAQAMQELRHRK